jgi:hypothetical protein
LPAQRVSAYVDQNVSCAGEYDAQARFLAADICDSLSHGQRKSKLELSPPFDRPNQCTTEQRLYRCGIEPLDRAQQIECHGSLAIEQ